MAQIPKQENNYDCGIFVIYFARAAVEALNWVLTQVRQQVSEGAVLSEAGRYNELVDIWGSNIQYLRSWIHFTLENWIIEGTTEGGSSQGAVCISQP